MLSNKILNYRRSTKRIIVLLVDLLLLPLALWASFSLRLDVFYVPTAKVVYLFFAIPFIAIPIFVYFGLYRAIIRYMGFLAMWAVVKAVSLYTLAWGAVVLLGAIPGVPRSVLLINWLVTLLLIGGSRALARWWLTGNLRLHNDNPTRPNVAIYGAGAAGIQIAKALSGSPDFNPVVFIDDNRSLQGNYIFGLRVYSLAKLAKVIQDLAISEVLLAMPSVTRSQRSKIIAELEPYALHVTTLPGMDDLASGKLKADDIREVGISDLLGRNQVDPNQELLNANIHGKMVLVTGAGGSIGSELCRQIIKLEPTGLILYERSEHDLYLIEMELLQTMKQKYPDKVVQIIPILASILDQSRIESVCMAFNVETIYHAAAYKHVPMVEKNPSEAVRNNVIGTYRVALAAIKAETETFVLISTDKAVRPTNTMGATKRFAEMILQELAGQNKAKTRFSMVRFGNVLGSSGSVIPLFREQIKNGGPVTVTDPEIIRYFMTIPEAAQLVIQAGAMGDGGEVFVLDMGDPVKILDMAKRMIHLSGLKVKDGDNPEGDIEIVFSGLRPGEKLYEELLIGDNDSSTQHPLIKSANEESLPWESLQHYINQFEAVIESNNVGRSRALLVESVKGFSPQCEVVDLVQLKKSSRKESQNGKDKLVSSPS